MCVCVCVCVVCVCVVCSVCVWGGGGGGGDHTSCISPPGQQMVSVGSHSKEESLPIPIK